MPSIRRPLTSRSYALIIGASEYADRKYEDLDTVRASAEKFASLMASEAMWNLPADGHVRTLTGRVTTDEAATAIQEAAARPGTDGLFIYICAHGRRWTDDHVPDRDLHFAFSDSSWDRPFDHLPFQWVRHALKRRTAADTLLVIDSCFSDVSGLGGAAPPPPTRVSGACTLTATKDRVLADTSWPGTDYTAFSGALIDIIRDGIEDAGEYLTPETVFDTLRDKLVPAHPEPGITKDATSVFLCPNSAYRPVANETPVNELLIKVSGPDAVDPPRYATAIENTSPADAARVVEQFSSKRPADETVRLADLLRSRSAPALGDYADRLIEHFYATRDGEDITGLLHRLHGQDAGAFDAGAVLRQLKKNQRAAEVTADTAAALGNRDCPDCQAISDQLFDALPAEWEERLPDLLAVLHSGEPDKDGVSRSHDGRLRVFRTVAASRPIDGLSHDARKIHATGLTARSVQAIVNVSVLVEFAAELRPPSDIARLITKFGPDGPVSDLGRLALDAAAAQRPVADLDALVGALADAGSSDEAGRLLEAVVLRRMPRDVAELLDRLLEAGKTMLIEKLTDARTPDECRVSVVFWLRAHGRNELAPQTARRMAERLRDSPAARTGLIRGLLAQQDTESADLAIATLRGPDLDELAGLIGSLRENGPYATHIIDDTLAWLDPVALLNLASLLEKVGYAEGARRIWKRIIPRMTGPALIGTLAECGERTGDASSANEPLRIAAETHPVRPGKNDTERGIADLAIEVKGRIRDGDAIVLRRVAEVHPVADIFDLAGQLDGRGRGDLSRLLLGETARLIHDRPDGGQAAEFIDLMMRRPGGSTSRPGWRRPRQQVPAEVTAVLENVARQKSPERLMSLIAGLERPPDDRRHSRYHQLHEHVEEIVAGAYTGTELARLPLVRRRDYLPAVLEIIRKALETPRGGIAETQFPDVLIALNAAGAENSDLRLLLIHIGATNKDRVKIAQAFRDRGEPDAAEYVLNGPKSLPLFEIRFYPPDQRQR